MYVVVVLGSVAVLKVEMGFWEGVRGVNYGR